MGFVTSVRPRVLVASAAFVASSGVGLTAQATTLQAGPGKTYATPCAAIALAKANDEVDVSPGTYTDSCEIDVAGLTVKGVGGQPKLDASGTNHPADYEGIFVIGADDVRIENLELTGAHVDDSEGGNAAALRVTGHGLVVHGCTIHDNQNGVLAVPLVDGGTITIEYTELSHNGLGDECDHDGCTHNVYVSKNGAIRYDRTIFQFDWSHDLASDTADKGHLLKSRSRETDVLYNRITGETGHDSYEVDVPNAGLALVVGNLIEKGANADNPILLSYGEEGIDSGQATTLYVASNTFVNAFASGTFIRVAGGGALTAHDNLFVGPGTLSSTGALSADNRSVDPSKFVNPSIYDYHLVLGSPAIGAAVDPGHAGSFSLTPAFEYAQPLLSVARLSEHDLGAYEFGTAPSNAGPDAGGIGSVGSTGGTGSIGDGGGGPAAGDGGGLGASDGGGGSGATHAGSNATGDSGSSPGASGCGCHVASPRGRTGDALVATFVLGLALVRRRHR